MVPLASAMLDAATALDKLRRATTWNIKLRTFSETFETIRAGRRLVNEYLKEHPCTRCGESDPVALEFNHLDPATRSANISDRVHARVSVARIHMELEKCDVCLPTGETFRLCSCAVAVRVHGLRNRRSAGAAVRSSRNEEQSDRLAGAQWVQPSAAD
jgi:hypothetical protein